MGFSLSQRKTCVFPHTECMCRLQGFPLEGKDWSELPPYFKNIKFTIYPLIKCLSSPWGAPSPRILCPTFLKITFSSNFFLWREVMKSIIGSNFQAILVKIASVYKPSRWMKRCTARYNVEVTILKEFLYHNMLWALSKNAEGEIWSCPLRKKVYVMRQWLNDFLGLRLSSVKLGSQLHSSVEDVLGVMNREDKLHAHVKLTLTLIGC